MRFIDTHAHLDFPDFDHDRAKVIDKLEEAQIGVINPASTVESVEVILKLVKQCRYLWAAIGLHPTEINNESYAGINKYLDTWQQEIEHNSKIVALGEVGLDYFHNHANASSQKAALRQFLTLAIDVDKPVIFHSRQADGDLFTLLSDYPKVRGVIHCFSGNLHQARDYLELGHLISFTANITYPHTEALQEVVKSVPIEKIMLETDSPFLAPQGVRGTRNDPFGALEVAKKIAEIKSVKLDEVLKATTENAQNFFEVELS